MRMCYFMFLNDESLFTWLPHDVITYQYKSGELTIVLSGFKIIKHLLALVFYCNT